MKFTENDLRQLKERVTLDDDSTDDLQEYSLPFGDLKAILAQLDAAKALIPHAWHLATCHFRMASGKEPCSCMLGAKEAIWRSVAGK